MSFRTR